MIIDYVKSVTERIFAVKSTVTMAEEAPKALLFGPIQFHLVLSDKLDVLEADKVGAFTIPGTLVDLTFFSSLPRYLRTTVQLKNLDPQLMKRLSHTRMSLTSCPLPPTSPNTTK